MLYIGPNHDTLSVSAPGGARPSARSNLQRDIWLGSAITTTNVDILDGVPVDYVSIPDISDADWATRESTQREIAVIDEVLELHPEFAAPSVDEVDGTRVFRPNNPVAAWLYETKPSLRTWRTNLVPTAMALTPVYRPDDWTLPTGELIDPATRNYFIHSLDAIGIRTRAAAMSAIAQRYLRPAGTTRWASLACGAAIPVFQALGNRQSGSVDVKLVDLDPAALAHAARYAAQSGFVEGVDFQLLKRHLIREMILTPRLVEELGDASMDFVDMLGIFEYIPEEFNGMKSAAMFLHNAFRLVKPGGAMVIANILDSHPRLHFNQRGIGWPGIIPRSQADLLRIVSDAGIGLDQVAMTVAEDGIFAVVEIRKP